MSAPTQHLSSFTPRFDPACTLISYVAEIARARPDAPALVARDQVISYSELLSQADAIAAALVERGVGVGSYVGLFATRSEQGLAGMLGILRAGAAFVPLDPSYSSDVHLRQIAEQIPFAAVLVQSGQGNLATDTLGARADCLPLAALITSPRDAAGPLPKAQGEDPACMVFTSGTTGKPKGVILPNRGLTSFGLEQSMIGTRPDDTVLHASSLACDGGLIEVWLGLLGGAALAMVEGAKPALAQIAATMQRHKVTVTSQYVGMHNLLIDHHADAFATVRLAMAGGDVMSPGHIRRLKSVVPALKMVNIYGPSETTCISLVQEVRDDLLTGAPIPIGEPMPHECAFVVDDDLRPVADGEPGQLAIGGHGVALGYYGLPDKTGAVFVADPRPGQTGRVYLTGDLATRRADGVFEFGGRADRQIKLGGRRIELDGIEHVLRQCDRVHNAFVEIVKTPSGDRRIGAVLQPESGVEDADRFTREVLSFAETQLHREMLPRQVLVRDALPLTVHGKPDRKSMRTLLEAELVAKPATPAKTAASVQEQIAAVWSDMLGCGPLDAQVTFFEAGGSSLQLIDAHARMQTALGVEFDLTLLFETPRLGDLAATLAPLCAANDAPETKAEDRPDPIATDPATDNAIAIVGLAARVPGADDLDQFWDHICQGDNLIQRFTPDQLQDAVSDETRRDPAYVPARSVLKDVEQFDAKFFGILPREAELMDPQARVFLEICVEALDDAGLDPDRATGPVGVYAGSSISTYMLNNLMSDRAMLESFTSGFQIDNYTTLTGNITDALATRVAFKLNLKGPALTVHTACSTSLTAIAQAVTALRANQCDVALAGGVSITFPQQRGYLSQEGGMSSPDGLCRPFDAAAGGTVFGHGAGVLVLKRLDRAIADGDRIDAVIRGVGLNNDGSDKIAFTAPSVTGQADAIRAAHRDGDVAPETISYVECHGTATPLGDPIEVRALTQAFGDTHARCALGSVKGNIGHLDAGAGAISVIKTVRMLRERVIPPVAHFNTPNPRIDFGNGRFYVPKGCEDWVSDGPRRAGVSGFGVGGTNVHLVLEEAPEIAQPETRTDPVQILPLSAKSPEALSAMAAQMTAYLSAETPDLDDVALTLQEGRAAHPWRMAVAATSAAQAAERFQSAPAVKRAAQSTPPPVTFMFPGQGAQYPGMGYGLYRDEPEFARWLDRGCEVLNPLLGLDLSQLLGCADASDEEAARALRDTRLTQPALFLVQYATARLWATKGIAPDAMIGHSVGEFTAATLAGVMEFETALGIIAKRGQLMQDQPTGAMLSVRASLDDLNAHLDDSVDLAASNAPRLHVIAGEDAAITAMAQRLEGAGIATRPLHTSHAFHSRMMQPMVGALAQEIETLTLNAPRIPYVSCVTGDWITDAQATDAAYWAGQARAPVRFADGLHCLTANAAPALLEVGAGNTLSTFAAQTLVRDGRAAIVQSLPDHTRPASDSETMAQALGALWSAGVPVDWARATRRGQTKLRLPGTVFCRKRHWVDAVAPQTTNAPVSPVAQQPDLNVMPVTPEIAPRLSRLTDELIALFADLSGEDLTHADTATPFLELGFDSLFMGQAAQALCKTYGVEMTFRSLLADYPTLNALAQHLDATLAPEPEVAVVADPVVVPMIPTVPVATQTAPVEAGTMQSVMQAQMQMMQSVFAEQLRVLGGAAAETPAPLPVPEVANTEPAKPEKPAFKAGRAPSLAGADLTPEQLKFAQELAARYSARFPGSKSHAQENRDVHADPRTAAGFRAEWKELTFPIVADRSAGAYIHDIDGNELVDLVNGFGQTAFGHSPDFVSAAITAQLERGYAIGPQSDLAGPVARKFATMVGHERVTFCNTGSEAVMAAMRLARAVTGRDRIVVFSNDYHGQFDEVLVKGKARGTDPTALPIAPGIPRDAVANIVVLGYGDPDALNWITDNIDDIAAVIIEPVQSRHPELRPVDFVRDLRAITAQGGAALVFDEVVTGFRTHARGMQGVWGIQGDMATYGKVVGGGMPIGVLAGDARFMDALDGGAWAYGDDSAPQVAPTFFAGTFVRHPLVVAAVDAVLDHLETSGDQLWDTTAARTAALATRMNAALAARGLPDLVVQYSSWFVIQATQHDPRATLLYALMRLEGVHVLDGFCGFLTTVHGDAECDRIATAFETALDQLQAVGILAGDGARAKHAPRLPLVPDGPVPLTESQREIWMTHQLGDMAAASFNESLTLNIDGPVDIPVLKQALKMLVARHESLRLRFLRDGTGFTVAPPQMPDLHQIDLSGAADPEAALDELLHQNAALPFDLVGEPPFRTRLVRLDSDRHALVLSAHHIVCDGWSFNTLLDELAALYTARVAGRDPDLAPAPSFAAFARNRQTRTAAPATRDHWRRVYADVPALPDLPTDRSRGDVKTFSGSTIHADIGSETLIGLRKSGAALGCTLFSTLFAGLQITLARLSGSTDIVLGVPTGGQAGLDDPTLVGHLVNFLPIRAPLDINEPARDHMARVAQTVLDAFEHGDYTLGTLVRDLDIPRNLSRLPLTEVQFNLERLPDGLAFADTTVDISVNAKAAVNYDLFFNMVESPKGLRIELDYNTDLFDRETVARWLTHLENVLVALAADSGQTISSLPMLSAAQERQQLDTFNQTKAPFPEDQMVQDLVARVAEKLPTEPAVTDHTGTLRYDELADASDKLAAHIQNSVTAQTGRIGVAMPRGAGMVVALLAVLKAGFTYVPLDPSQPIARQNTVLQTAGVLAVLAPADALSDLTKAQNIIAIDPQAAVPGQRPRPIRRDVNAPAYVIFTSGSTGAPKGVVIPHRAVVNFLTSMAQQPGFTAQDKILSVTTVSFDIAVLELFLPLSVGGHVEIATRADVQDGFRLVERLDIGDITVMQATPTLWTMLCEAGFTPRAGLKILVGGEPLPADLADRLGAEGAELWNMYGPTETTIWSAVGQVQAGTPVTIGVPIANTQLLVLDGADRLCPPGVIGELNIGGDGLAIGYHERPDLTVAAFRPVTIADQVLRLYKTGDLAVRRPDGTLHLLGRRDAQVKLRGYRIELGEIEAHLRGHDAVSAAAVALRRGKSGEGQLVGYVVPRERVSLDTGVIASRLGAVLPEYMVPRVWVPMAELPQTANGKLDRNALPEPTDAAPVQLLRSIAPAATPTETMIAEIWSDVLGLDEVSVTDTVFALGVDSLAVFRIAARLMDRGLNLEARHVLDYPSIRALAAFADARAPTQASTARPSLKAFLRRPDRTGT